MQSQVSSKEPPARSHKQSGYGVASLVIGLVIATALLALLCWFFWIMIGFAFAYLALVVNVAIIKLTEPELDRQLSQKRPRAS